MSEPGSFEPGVPRWLAQAGIGRGEWTQAVKTQFRSLLRPCFPLKVRLWSWGMLHTVAYQTQEAVTLQEGRRRPVRPADAIREMHREATAYYRSAGITDNLDKLKESRQNVRRGFEDLEADGVMERRRALDDKPFRELSAPEKRKLNGGKVKYIFYLEPKAADPETVRQEYRERLEAATADKAKEVVIPRLPFSPEQIRAIRHISNAFGLSDSPFLRLDENTPPEHVAIIVQAIETAKDLFIKTCKEAEPDAILEPRPRNEVMQTESKHGAHPGAAVTVSGTESMKGAQQGTEPERLTEQTTTVPDSSSSDPYRELRAGLVARGIDTLDDGALGQISDRLNGTPIERYWLQLGDRLKRGKPPFKALLEHAQAATRNYHAAQQILNEQEQYNRSISERRRADEIEQAREILKKPPETVPSLDRQWAQMVLQEAS